MGTRLHLPVWAVPMSAAVMLEIVRRRARLHSMRRDLQRLQAQVAELKYLIADEKHLIEMLERRD